MGLYEVRVSIYLLGFGMGAMLVNSQVCGFLLLLRTVLNMFLKNV